MADRLVVFAPNWLGDAVMALPALTALRRHWPGAHVAVAARASVAPLYGMVPGVDEVRTLETTSGLAAVKRWRRDALRLAGGQFDTAVLLPNSFLSAWIASQAGIPERWGYAADLRARLLTRPVPRPREAVHQADYYLALVEALGVSRADRVARIEVSDAAREEAAHALAAAGVGAADRYVAMAPGAAYGRAKQWPPERYAALAARLHATAGLRTVLVGAKSDGMVCREIGERAARLAVDAPAVADLSGRTTVPGVAGVLARAAAVVANDSGAMHLAGAVGVPVVAVFGSTNEQQTSPLTARAGQPVRIVTHPVWCRPCMLRECPIDHRCMREIGDDHVMSALENLVIS
ncbi:MAG: lipopolysaccharide heptosyltransferase II [Vicinamibacteria bacterium]